MTRLALITHPAYDASSCMAAARSLGVGYTHVKYWEQMTQLCASSHGPGEICLNSRPLGDFDCVLVVQVPEFSRRRLAAEQITFEQSEWAAAMHTLMQEGRPFANGRALCKSATFGYSSMFLLGRLPAEFRAEFKYPSQPRVTQEFHLLLNWECVSHPESARLPSEQVSALLELMRRESLDFLVVEVDRRPDGEALVCNLHITPPPSLPLPFWEVLIHGLSL